MWLFFYDCHSVNYILKRLLVIFRQIWRRTSMKFVPRYGFLYWLCAVYKKVCPEGKFQSDMSDERTSEFRGVFL